MKVLHVIHSLDPRSGGPSHAIRSLVREQVRAEHAVAVLATDVQSAEPWEPREEYRRRMTQEAAFSGLELFLGRSFGRRPPWSRFSYSPECAGWLRRRLSDEDKRPDVVHIHGVFSHVTTAAAAAARRCSVPYVLRLAGTLDHDCLRMGRRRWKQLFSRWFLMKDLRWATALHATSDAEAAQLPAWARKGRVHVVPHGVEVPPLNGCPPDDELRASYPQLAGKRIVLYISRVAPIKRPELLVGAVAALRSDHSDLALVIAGHDAGHMAALKESVRRHGVEQAVVFTGFMEGEAKRAAFAAADLFALPSLHENFGVAVVEAMAHSVPVLVTPGVAAHSYVDQSGGGLTVSDSVGAIADGIRRILASDLEEMGRRGRAYVEAHLTWPAVVRQLDELYRRAIDQCRASPAN